MCQSISQLLRTRLAICLQFKRVEKPLVCTHCRQSSSHVTTKEGAVQNGLHRDDPFSTNAVEEYNRKDKTHSGIPISSEKALQEMLLLKKPNLPDDSQVLNVAIIGSPNAGKSTLINRLMGQRICSVSSKVHTTRSTALAVLTRNNTQIVLLDTPGMVSHLHGRRHQLSRPLLVDPKNSLEKADLAIVLVDASNKWTCEKISPEILVALHHNPNVQSVLVLNKVDLISSKQQLFSLTAQLTEGVIGNHKFTLDNRTAYSLGKVETSPMLSHKYKPRMQPDDIQSIPMNKSERTDQVQEVTTDSRDNYEADIPTFVPQNPDAKNKVPSRSNDSSSTESSIDPVLNLDSVSHQKFNTLGDYVSTLEGFSSKSSAVEAEEVSTKSEEMQEDQKRVKQEQRELLKMMMKRNGWDGFDAVFMISALSGEGLEDVKEHLMEKAVPGIWEYHEDVVTNLSPEEILVEAIREKLLEHLPQEVPYNLSQRNELWTTLDCGKLRIIQKIVCHKKSHVNMLKKRIGIIAREAEDSLVEAFHQDVHLTLGIKQ
ncbi:GTPase Era, mitochondrial-like isoform X1 [Asterias rubens]|uniref:GTPase Era, mitochondrial-like isoform X1 n=1 Tax=Asterias rubens TaxID=7604 RepID=UPI00145590F6|nr:GTPase Era, mitochondrial-like isoform X1 [Asterias rubens]